MSIDLVAAALWLDLSPQRKLVLVSLCENADLDGFCWPSRDYIAARASLTTRSVTPHLKALEVSGWMAITRNPRPGYNTERLLATGRIIEEGEERRRLFMEERRKQFQAERYKGEESSPFGNASGKGEAASPRKGEAASPHNRHTTSGNNRQLERPVPSPCLS